MSEKVNRRHMLTRKKLNKVENTAQSVIKRHMHDTRHMSQKLLAKRAIV